uniref:Uncharacterized protein n=1 Tax=Medicago truncatula TaxID=3880 RepID=I3SBT3_MEDTR|nr:unknown [Medicago truncatula]
MNFHINSCKYLFIFFGSLILLESHKLCVLRVSS